MTDEQWPTIYLGSGGRGESITALMHAACGALIANRPLHEQVCTAPPWEPTPINIGETHDWQSDGSRT